MSGDLVKNSGLSLVIAKLALDLTKEVSNEIRNIGIQANDTSGPIVLTSKAEVNPSVTIGATGTGGGVKLFGDTGGVEITSNNGDINLLAGTGTINIGTDGNDGTLNLGSSGSTNINSGTGGTYIGTSGTMNIVSSYLGNSAISIYAGASNNSADVYGNALLLSTAGNGMCTQILTSGKNANIILDTKGEIADINLLTNGTGSKTKISSDTQILLEQTSAESTVSGIILATSATTQTDEPSIVIDASDGASNILIIGGNDTEYGGVTINGGGGPVSIGDNSSSTTITSVKGSINIEAGSHYANVGTININTDGTNSDQINIINTSGTNYNAINIQSNAIGGGINMSANGGDITLDDVTSSSGTINIGNTNASNINVGNSDSDTTLSGKTLNIEGGSHYLNPGTININTDGTGDDQISIINSQGNHQSAIIMQSNGIGGGINMSVNGGGIVLDDTNTGTGYINIGHSTASVINIGNTEGNIRILGNININNEETNTNVNINTSKNSGIVTIGNIDSTSGVDINTHSGSINLTSDNSNINLICGNYSDTSSINIQTHGDVNDTISIKSSRGTSNEAIILQTEAPLGGIQIKASAGKLLLTDPGSADGRGGTVNIISGGAASGAARGYITMKTEGNENDTITITNTKGTFINSGGINAIDISAPLGGIQLSSGTNSATMAGSIVLQTTGVGDDKIKISNLYGSTAGALTLSCINPSGNMLMETNGGGITINDTDNGNININSSSGNVTINTNSDSNSNTTIGNTLTGGKVSLNSSTEIDLTSGIGGSPGKIYLLTQSTTDDNITIKNTLGTDTDAINIVANGGGINLYGNGGIVLDASNGVDGVVSLIGGNGGISIKEKSTGKLELLADGGGDLSLLNTKNGHIIINSSFNNEKADNIYCSGESTTITGGPIALNSTYNNVTAISLTTNGGNDEKILIKNTQGVDSDAISLVSSAGGIDINAYNGINIDAGSHYSNIGTINISTDGTINDQILIINTQGTNTEAIKLVSSAGGITLESKYGGININSQSDSDVVTIGNTGRVDIASGDVITLQAKGSGVLINTTTNNNTTIGNISSDGGIVKMESSIIDNNAIILNAPDGYISLLGKNLDLNNTGGGNTNIGSKDHMSIVNILSNTFGVNINASGGDAVTIGNSSSAGVNLSGTNGSISIGNTGNLPTGVDITSSNGNGVNINTTGTSAVNIGNTGVTTTFKGTVDFTDVIVQGLSGGSEFSGDYYGNITLNTTGSGTTTIGNIKEGGIVDINSADTITLQSKINGVNINTTGTSAVNIGSSTGGPITLESTGNISLSSSSNSSEAINLAATNGYINIKSTNYSVNINTSGTDKIIIGNDITDEIKLTAANNITLHNTDGTISLSAINNTPKAISLITNGGNSETILIKNTQGTGLDAINLLSTAGGITLDSKKGTTLTGGLILTQKTTTPIIANTIITTEYSGSVVEFRFPGSDNIIFTLPNAEDMIGQTYTFIQGNENTNNDVANYVKFTTGSGGFLGTNTNGTNQVNQLDGTKSNLYFSNNIAKTVKGDWIEFKGISSEYIMVRAVSSVSDSIKTDDSLSPS